MTFFFSSCSKFFSGIWGSASLSKATFLSQNLCQHRCCVAQFCFSSDVIHVHPPPYPHPHPHPTPHLCMRSNPVLHTPSHAHTQRIHPISLAHAIRQPDSWRPPTHPTRGSWMVPPLGGGGVVFVGGDEPGSSALSPAVQIQWVHSHTCLIAWPIRGGARRGWRPL